MIIHISGRAYDVTEFLNEHPGGEKVFQDGADLTEQFEKVEHSEEAREMMKQYEVVLSRDASCTSADKDSGPAEEELQEGTQSETDRREEAVIRNTPMQDILLTKFNQLAISRLFTHEDKTNIHKTLGLLVLANASYFMYDLVYSGCKGELTLRKKDGMFITLFWLQILLSTTSLQFELPTKYNRIKPFMSQEYRLLVIAYTLRSILIATCLYCFGKSIYSHFVIVLVTLGTTYCADLIAKHCKDESDNLGAKIGSYPFWSSCDATTRKAISTFYSFGSILFTLFCISDHTTIELNYYVAFSLQLLAFFYTLSKKNLISTFQWHMLYMAEVLAPLFLFYGYLKNRLTILPLVALMWYLRTKVNVNKYVLWSLFSICTALLKYTSLEGPKLALALITTVAILVTAKYKNALVDPPRISQHDVVVSNELQNRSGNVHEIKVRMATPAMYRPGQYFNIYFDCEKRPYTPIGMQKDNRNLSFAIKNCDGQTVSGGICKYFNEGKPIAITGPFGKKYYDAEKDEILCDGKPIKERNVLMFCCGTGVTPFESMLCSMKERRTEYKCKLFCSFHSKEGAVCLRRLKAKPQLFLSSGGSRLDTNSLEKQFSHRSLNKTCVLICGTPSYNKLVSDFFASSPHECKVIVW